MATCLWVFFVCSISESKGMVCINNKSGFIIELMKGCINIATMAKYKRMAGLSTKSHLT